MMMHEIYIFEFLTRNKKHFCQRIMFSFSFNFTLYITVFRFRQPYALTLKIQLLITVCMVWLVSQAQV